MQVQTITVKIDITISRNEKVVIIVMIMFLISIDSEYISSSSLPLLIQPGDTEKEYLFEIKKVCHWSQHYTCSFVVHMIRHLRCSMLLKVLPVGHTSCTYMYHGVRKYSNSYKGKARGENCRYMQNLNICSKYCSRCNHKPCSHFFRPSFYQQWDW